MPLSHPERRALDDAVRITNAVIAGGHDPLHTAVALTTLASVMVGDDPAARMALAWQMLQCADELMVASGGVETASCNGHAVALGSR